MKTWIASLFFFVSTYAQAGAVSGGGGGTTTPEQMDPQQIRSFIDSSRYVIQAWLNEQESDYFALPEELKSHSPYFELFASGRDPFHVLAKMKINVRSTAPCKDQNGQNRDGSVDLSASDSICISVYTLAEKLNAYNIEAEVSGLIYHEFAHLMGSDEFDAQKLQSEFVKNLRHVSSWEARMVADVAYFTITHRLGGILSSIKYLMDPLIPIERRDLWDARRDIYKMWHDLSPLNSRLHPLRRSNNELIQPYAEMLDMLGLYFCSEDANEDPEIREICLKDLNRGFAGNDALDAETYLTNRDGSSKPHFSRYFRVVYKRPKSRDDFNRELQRVYDFMEKVAEELDEIRKVHFQRQINRVD